MFCFQCQETLKNTGCTINGMCGKKSDTAKLQDLLVYTTKGISVAAEKAGVVDDETGHYVVKALFTVITNVNFDDDRIISLIKQGLKIRDDIKSRHNITDGLHDSAVWNAEGKEEFLKKAEKNRRAVYRK